MTYLPSGSAAPPSPAAPTLPAVPPQGTPPPGPAVMPERRSARAELTDRLRSASTTEPGRLRIIGAVIAVLVIAFGAVTAWQMAERSSAADDVLHRSAPLSSDAAAIYRSLADANTAAASGFLAANEESPKLRQRYQDDLDMAAEKLSTAAGASRGSGQSARYIEKLNKLLPEFAERIESARTYNRQGLPLGGAYLRNANDLMQNEMLPAAEDLYEAEKKQLNADYADAKAYPWGAIALGVVAIGGLVWAQRRNYRRTNRVFNHGMVVATAAGTVVLLWLAVGHTFAYSGLSGSYDDGVRSLNALNDARISILQARSSENLTLVSRGAVTVPEGKPKAGEDFYDVEFQKQMAALGDKTKGTLGAAWKLSEDEAGDAPVDRTVFAVTEWKKRHTAARTLDNQGNYDAALAGVIGENGDQSKATGDCFDLADKSLDKAIAHEQQDFRSAAEDGRGAMTGLPVGAAVLAVLGATGAVLGIGRRLSEYR
ncbi:hypothetical protein G6045_12085 [Streptomyces sp. YC504]|uniref:Secreted protein n=1 Tax=Streptomyces mesophilus TaxID=1775132 RepID=A0A6G4XGN3_9ACTN|nr:hypothetical protein [Streptomyces mesophilus]NGO76393.1 hypothetical protein [Streptomyces mesophilus]